MTLIETGPGLWERLNDAPVEPEAPTADDGERLDREQLSARVREALRGGSLDELEDAIVRETVGYLTDPYIDSNTLMGVQDLNPRLAAAWNNGARDLAKDERRREVSRARILSVFAPPAHNAVRQHQNYVIGQGVPKPTAAIGNADIQAVIDDLWSDPANHEFTTHNGQKRADANQIIDGELFVAIAIDEQDGHCKWRTVDPLDIDDLVTDPDDASRVLYYRVRQAKTDYDFGRGLVKDGSATDKYVYFRDWRNTDPALDPYNGKAQPAAPEHMVMAHWPINTLGLRGIPDMVCAAPWIAAHKSFMNNRTILHEALSKIAFVKTVKGGAPAVNASALAEQSSLTNSQYSGQERNPQPAPYAIMTKNAGVDIEQLKVDSGASNAQTDGEMLAQMFSTGVGLPTHYSIMSVEAHRLATATAMELPVLKMFLSSQQGWLDMLRDLIDFALLQAATAGRIKAKIVTKHGRQLIDWDNSPAAPETPESKDQPAAPSNVTPFRRKKAAASDDAQASVREALEDSDAVAQAEHIEKAQEPSAQDKQAQKKRGHYTIDMPPILQKDVAATITAVVQALQAGTLTPELAANQVMIALGFDDVSDKMDEWRSYVQTQAQQAVDRAAQEHDMAQQQLAAKAGPPGAGGPPKAPPFGAAPTSSPQATAREAFTEAQLAVLAEAGLTLVREAGGGGHWITIEQDGESTHIFIGAHGMVTKGPKHLIGANIAHLPPIPGKRSVTHHPDGHVPAGHDAHPHYTEHQDKKHVYGKHGPGVGYDVDNPLPKKTAEQAEDGLQKSVEASKEHKATQDAEQAKADAETKAKADEAEKKAQIGKKNSEALASAHEHTPFVVTQHPETGKYHVTNGLTATSHTAHETEDEAKKVAAQKNDNHFSELQAGYNTEQLNKATKDSPYVSSITGPRKYEVYHSGTLDKHSEHTDEDGAQDTANKLNAEHRAASSADRESYNRAEMDKTTPDRPYAVQRREDSDKFHVYNSNTMDETEHDTEDEARTEAEHRNNEHEAAAQAKRKPFYARQQTDGYHDWEIADKRSGGAVRRHIYANQQAAEKKADELNMQYTDLQQHDLSTEQGWNNALLTHLRQHLGERFSGGRDEQEDVQKMLRAVGKSGDIHHAILALARHSDVHRYGYSTSAAERMRAAVSTLDDVRDDIRQLDPEREKAGSTHYLNITNRMRTYADAFGKMPTAEELKPENREAFDAKVEKAAQEMYDRRTAEREKGAAGAIAKLVTTADLKDAGLDAATARQTLTALKRPQSHAHLLHALAQPFVHGETFDADHFEQVADRLIKRAADSGTIQAYSGDEQKLDHLAHGLRHYFDNNEALPSVEQFTERTLNNDAMNGAVRKTARKAAQTFTDAARTAHKDFQPTALDVKEYDDQVPIKPSMQSMVHLAVASMPHHIQSVLNTARARAVLVGSTRGRHRPELKGVINPATGTASDDNNIAGTWHANLSFKLGDALPTGDGLAEVYAPVNWSDEVAAHTATHELGHALDEACAHLFGAVQDREYGPQRAFRWSEMPDFKAIYDQHQGNMRLWSYMREANFEMFAEGYSMWLRHDYNPSSGDVERGGALKDQAPELYTYFEQLNERIRKHVEPRVGD